MHGHEHRPRVAQCGGVELAQCATTLRVERQNVAHTRIAGQ